MSSARARSWLLLLALISALLAPAFLVAPPHAAAHASLVGTTPSDGSQVDGSPGAVNLRFSEPITLVEDSIRVLDRDAERVDTGGSRQDASPEQASVALLPGLPDGVYTVAWRVISGDSHPIRGSFTFTVGDPADASAVPEADLSDEASSVWDGLALVLRWIIYAGALAAAGLVVLGRFILPRDQRHVSRQLLGATRITAIAGLLAIVVSIPVNAITVAGPGLSGSALATVLGSSFGSSALLGILGLALMLAPARGLLPILGAVLATAAFVLAGHSVTAQPQSLVLASDLVHVGAAAVWLGGLLGLLILLRGSMPAEAAARTVARFSTIAAILVTLLALSGTAMAWAEIRDWSSLDTRYGWILLAKIAGVVLVIAVAAYNRWRLVPRIQQRSSAAPRQLARALRIEAIGLLIVLALTAVLVATSPPRPGAGPHTATLELSDTLEATITVTPAVAGSNSIELLIRDEQGEPVTGLDAVTLRLSHPASGIENIERPAIEHSPGSGEYHYSGTDLAIPGDWDIEIRVLVSDFELLTATTTARIHGRTP
ncbi:copper resistance CopC/CopD family protein [Lolliginicoccus suaedae]|uniref:copper resistance CopC/CopD family protein n=1 Tax=Lolliginicoccus suaedae TaxID=2605429 RepID=UPI0011ECEF83|nr:copper resistance protein CopC [Lolliginicoccus suaedae]